MKIKQTIYGLLALAAAGMAGGCQNSFDDTGLVTPVARMQANSTMAEFKTRYMNEPNQLCGYKDEASKTPWIVKGRVVSSDLTGNIYQTLSLQDETAAMTFAIRRAGLYEYYSVGQEVVVNLTDLWVGQYNYLMQIGWISESATGVAQMGRVNFDIFQTHAELNGLPDREVTYVTPTGDRPSDSMYCIVENIDQLPTAPGEDFYRLQGQLVEFRNVSFEGGGEEPYARFQESVSRYISQEGNSSKLCVYNSGYATFYSDTLPAGTGTVRGILSYYASDPTSTGSNGAVNGWQLLLRSKEDVIFNEEGTKEKPYTVEEVQGMMNDGRNGWVAGYIVGSVKAGVSTVTSNADIIFGAAAEMDNNLVIASSAGEIDWTHCLCVSLPQGSDLRRYGNLADNPAVYKKSILVQGSLSSYLGMPGVQGDGSATSFEIDGVVIGGGGGEPGQEDGDGSKEKPYSIAQVMNSTVDAEGVWVEGYVAGYVADMTWATSAVFGNQPTEGSTNYQNATNCILSSAEAGAAGFDNSIPCGLSTTGDVRATLGISKNPEIYGKKVKVKGDITKYFGLRGVKNVTEYELPEGGGPVNPPVDPPSGQGDGSEENPFSVADVMNSTSDSADVWIIGYVAGYVADMTWSTSAVFGSQATAGSTNYENATNCILSSAPVGTASLDNSVPCGLKNTGDVRETLGISKNPSIYGKRVKVKGEITKYFGLRGIKNVSEYRILD